MEPARRAHLEDFEETARAASQSSISMEGLEKVLRLTFPRDAEAPPAQPQSPRKPGPLSPTEIDRAIELVQEAAETIRAAEDRVRDAEARTQTVLVRAAEEIKASEARAANAEVRAKALEARLMETESRLRDAEAWLRQIFSAITEELPTRRPPGR